MRMKEEKKIMFIRLIFYTLCLFGYHFVSNIFYIYMACLIGIIYSITDYYYYKGSSNINKT